MMAHKAWIAFLVLYIGKSAAELCQGGQLEAVTGSCSKFRLCREGQWKELTCQPPKEVFDLFQRKCVSTRSYCLFQRRSTEHCKRDVCSIFHRNACTDGDKKGVKDSCKKYKECKGGVFVDKRCSQCQNFDENLGHCVFIWDKPCTDGDTSTTTTTTTTTVPSSTDLTTPATPTTTPSKCSPGQRKPDYENCSHYFECDNEGSWKNKSCWWVFFYKFDVNTSGCKFWSYKCAKK